MNFSVLLEWTVCAMMQAQVTPVAGRARQYGHADPAVTAGKALQGSGVRARP
jgi:hypothetical protein